MRVCAESGCPELCEGSYCEAHAKAKRRASAARRRKTPQQQMYAGVGARGRAWRRVRAEFLRANPTCQSEAGCIKPAEHVHHRNGDPLGPDGLDPSGLQGLCVSCHSRTTAAESPAGWNRGGTRPESSSYPVAAGGISEGVQCRTPGFQGAPDGS
jgi:5-methylcytosine-specific restriction protein A